MNLNRGLVLAFTFFSPRLPTTILPTVIIIDNEEIITLQTNERVPQCWAISRITSIPTTASSSTDSVLPNNQLPTPKYQLLNYLQTAHSSDNHHT
jgi:hypothetical protein